MHTKFYFDKINLCSFNQWDGCSCFPDKMVSNWGFVFDKHIRRSCRTSSLFLCFVFMEKSAEKPASKVRGSKWN